MLGTKVRVLDSNSWEAGMILAYNTRHQAEQGTSERACLPVLWKGEVPDPPLERTNPTHNLPSNLVGLFNRVVISILDYRKCAWTQHVSWPAQKMREETPWFSAQSEVNDAPHTSALLSVSALTHLFLL